MTTALERLTTGYYNSSPFNGATNPGGLGNGGHVTNLPLLLADIATVAAATNAAVLESILYRNVGKLFSADRQIKGQIKGGTGGDCSLPALVSK